MGTIRSGFQNVCGSHVTDLEKERGWGPCCHGSPCTAAEFAKAKQGTFP